MNRLSLSSVLLFALVVPFIMTYRIGPSDTPYWLFGIIFLNLLAFIVVDLLQIPLNTYNLLKTVLLWTIIIEVIGSAFVSSIIVRHQSSPVYMIHDIVVQQESAIRFLLHGKNPYATTYFGTPLEKWNYSTTEINPALYHFVMEPLYLLFGIPFYFLSNHLFGFFDGRVPLLFLFVSILIMIYLLIKDIEKRLLFMILLTFNPATLPYMLEGRSDFFMFAFLFAGFYFLHKEKYNFSALFIALAFSVKQSAWPLFPFYVGYFLFKQKSYSRIVMPLGIFFITIITIMGPFFLWDPKAFFESTIGYLSGSATHPYPISGYGLGMILRQMGIITSENQQYPFYIWQLIVGLPLIVILLKYLKNYTHVSRLILVYGIFLFVFWYFSRYFNNSHIAYLSTVFISAYLWPTDRK